MQSRYEIKDSQGKGRGLFAKQFIRRGTRIIAAEPMLTMPVHIQTDSVAVYHALLALPPEQRVEYMELAYDEAKTNSHRHTANKYNLAKTSKTHSAAEVGTMAKVAAIFDTNAFMLVNDDGS